jgi:pyridoxal 5'-phosphate synthase pdxT subunit
MGLRTPVGVLALQGDFEAHGRILKTLGAPVREVRTPADLDGIAALVMPGGESTTMSLGAAREGLEQPLRDAAARGLPILATCAGLILLDREHLGVLDMRAERNAFGRQIRSFEADVSLDGFGEPVHAVFIRAPWIAEYGPTVEPIGEVDGHVIAARSGAILAVAFHPELSGETRLHRWLLEQVESALETAAVGHEADRLQQDLDVEPDRPVGDVEVVDLDHL